MEEGLRAQLLNHLEAHNKKRAQQERPAYDESKPIPYGTAGFRGNAGQIEHIFYNLGLISGLFCLKEDANVGVMITASHNPIQDNGVKLISKNGEMLELDWEPIVEQFCNTHDHELLLQQLDKLIKEHNIDTTKKSKGRVMIGMDTRPSSEALADLVKQGLKAWSPLVDHVDYGLTTTPALHYLVGESNKQAVERLSLKSYYDQLIAGLVDIFQEPVTKLVDVFEEPPPAECQPYSPNHLVIDCANGVGSETMQYICKDANFMKHLPLELINVGEGILNKSCGADYVKTVQEAPTGAVDETKRYASLDGDADRIVYFFLEDQKLKLLDGDKILALYALYLRDVRRAANLEGTLSIGIIQTAYANYASTDYVRYELQLNSDFVDTGVKNLHLQAQKYDFGIYFEANGHGTILVSPKARAIIEQSDDPKLAGLKRLLAIINNYTGDAISNVLVVETILRHFDWDIKRWYSLYQDLPNTLIKVQVPDRDVIKTTNAGQTCLEPSGLQEAIDALVERFPDGRSFVRPSGTENVVRIYAEANDQESADKLANLVGEEVKKFCQ